jgi:large subunit ribosomal protein L17
MRKRKKGRKLSRKRDQRNALLKSLASAVILRERIKTTEAKAKEVSVYVEKFITTAKKGDLASRRRLLQFFSPKIVKKLMDEIAPRYEKRAGGYTRVIKLGQRKDDGAKIAFIELVK